MGCVFGKEVSSSERGSANVAGKGRSKREERDSGRREKVAAGSVNNSEGEAVAGGGGGGGSEVQAPNGHDKKEERKEESTRHTRERRRSRPNPRLSNPPKNIHGEQVAAGWPSWLSAVAGEAINGWTPRRADSFVKIDKVNWLDECD